jgi:hypothetical protein
MSQSVERCRSCGTSVFFLRNATTGKSAPIEAEPVAGGNIRVASDGTYRVLTLAERVAALASGELLHLNHFARCKDAPRWQRFGKGGRT